MMKVSDIINRVSLLYNDQDFIRVTKRQYIDFLDEAINQLITLRPDANTKTVIVPLQRGVRQHLPTEALQLIDIYANVIDIHEGVIHYGQPVFQITRKDIDYFRDWYQDTPLSGRILEFSYDRRTPDMFLVWPPVGPSLVQVEMSYSVRVPPYAAIDELDDEVMKMEVPLDVIYKTPLQNYMLYLLYSTDASSQLDRANAEAYERSFYQSLSIEYRSSITDMPRIFEQKIEGMGVPAEQGQVNAW